LSTFKYQPDFTQIFFLTALLSKIVAPCQSELRSPNNGTVTVSAASGLAQLNYRSDFTVLERLKKTNINITWSVFTADVGPIARMESLRAITHSGLESFRVLKSKDPNGVLSHPETLTIGEFKFY
jgi:hypothetical protein